MLARDHGRRRLRGADRRLPHRAAHEGRDGRRARRPGRARCARCATPVPTGRSDLVDTAGTGGGRPTFNVSTTAALIAAGAGCAVAKHGNRSATGLSGSADVLEALGARIDLAPEAVGRAASTSAGFGFMFAPGPPPATRFVVPVRKELAVRTIFNFLGPLTNPAGARRQVIGVSDPRYLERDRRGAGAPGVDRALVVSSEDGLDEMSTSGPTQRRRGRTATTCGATSSTPEDVGPDRAPAPTRSRGGTPERERRRRRARSSPASDGPRARPRAAQRRRGDLRRRRGPTRSREGVDARRRGRRHGAAAGDARRATSRAAGSWPAA